MHHVSATWACRKSAAYASLRHTTRCAHHRAVPGNTASTTRPRPALAMCSAAARVARGVALARSVVPQVAQQPDARTIQRKQRQALSLATPPFWRQHSKCPTAQPHGARPAPPSLRAPVSAAWWLAPHGQRVAQVLQLLRLRCWKRARTQQSGALHAPQAKVELVFQCLHLRRICAEQGRWVPQTALVPSGAQSSQQKFCKLQRLLLRRQLGLRCQSAHPAFC